MVTSPGGKTDIRDWKTRLGERLIHYIGIGDRNEQQRRRTDRIGARLLYDQHWLVSLPRGKAAVVCNIAKRLLKHKIALMTKQDPTPAIQPDGIGDVEPARRMNLVVQRIWEERELALKNKRVLLLSGACRTSAAKVVWDPDLSGHIGDIDADIVPPWRLILDNRCNDVQRMQFIGDRQTMPRSRAMRMYKHAAKEIEQTDSSLYGKPGGIRYQGSPITDPWNSGVSMSTGDSSNVMGTPVILTPVSLGPSPTTTIPDDTVEVIELYHRDPTIYFAEEVERDGIGNEIEEPTYDDNGDPVFQILPDEMHHDEATGVTVGLPNQKLVRKPKMRIVEKAKYPFWRRSTLLLPDTKVIDDIPWDGPAPYALYTDEEPLDGVQGKGSLLGLFTLQGVLNIGLSCQTDNIRQGSMQAFKAGAGANVETDQIVLTPGKVVKLQDIKQLEAIISPNISGDWITFNKSIVELMQFTFGLQGVMQGQAVGRMDSSAGVDVLAEIGGSEVDEATQRMGGSIKNLVRIIAWFAQNYYTEKHAVAVEDAEGNRTWERVWADQLKGNFLYKVVVGSRMAWSERARESRIYERLDRQIYDRTEAWKQLNIANWREIKDRQLKEAGSPIGISPPPRTRQTVNKPSTGKKQRGNGAVGRI